ncbi:MAG TPA: serine/threonine-protein kinase [Gemmatimonadales bacterium]|nr:serine/threonine-protein kinase [Gemmatimonadales bacterium]
MVCSSCHALLREGSSHCPRCGPGSLALFGAELASLDPHPTDSGALERLGRALGRHYRVVRLIGRGGFAEVYEVVDSDLQRRLAVKVLRSDLPWTAATISRFKQEARAIARLNHPNTVPIHFVGENEGMVYYAMPYLEGRTVADLLLAEGPLTIDRALRIVEPVLEALQHAHDHGLVHRDVKPGNILIESGTGRPLLVDFGIVKYLDGPAHLTDAGYIVGTPLYMSPEQALGSQSVDARSDLYGIGVVLFQLLTGAPPFEGTDSQEIVGRHISEPVPSANLSRDGIPPWISGIVLRCLAKHPDDRFPTARALLEAIRAARAGALAAAAVDPVTLLPRADETATEAMPAARSPGGLGWLVGIAAAAIAGIIVALSAPGRQSEAESPADYEADEPRATPGSALVVENRLTEPIALTMEDTGLTIPPGDSARLPVPEHEALEAHWAMVQPSTGDKVLGAAVEGAIVAPRVEGELRQVVDAEAGGESRIAPTVVNRAGRPLRVAVLAEDDSLDCDCRISPGDSLRLGYYRYTDRTALRVTDPAGWSARFTDFGARRDSASGAVVVRVERADLRRPPRATPRRAKPAREQEPERRNPLESFLPVR